jgi:hypothetical protein
LNFYNVYLATFIYISFGAYITGAYIFVSNLCSDVVFAVSVEVTWGVYDTFIIFYFSACETPSSKSNY